MTLCAITGERSRAVADVAREDAGGAVGVGTFLVSHPHLPGDLRAGLTQPYPLSCLFSSASFSPALSPLFFSLLYSLWTVGGITVRAAARSPVRVLHYRDILRAAGGWRLAGRLRACRLLRTGTVPLPPSTQLLPFTM